MKSILSLVLICLLSTSLWAQDMPWIDRNRDQPYVALASEYVTTLKENWSYEETYHARIKIQKEAGKDLGEWPIYYNRSRDNLTDIQAHVETADGHIVPATNIQDIAVFEDLPMYSNLRMKVISLPDINVGAVIDVTVKSVTQSKEIPQQFWAEILYPAIPSQKASHIYIFPENKGIQFKSYKTDYKPSIEKLPDGQVKYAFVFNETDAISTDEDLMPPLQEVLGGLYLSSMTDWKTVADWYRQLVQKNMIGDPDISLKTIELTKDKGSQKDKARAILEFLQDDFQYVELNFGDNTVEPNVSKEIFKNRYGDSKDWSLLVKQMLKIAGIDSNICLFSPEFAGNPQMGLPTPSIFNHVILQINLDGQNYFVDPLLKGFDFGQYPASYDNAHVLVITDSSFQFDQIPVAQAEDRLLNSHADIKIHEDGFASFKVHVKLPLETSQGFKQTWKASNKEEKEKFFENLEQGFTKGGKLTEKKLIGIEERYGQVEFELTYEAPTAYPVVNDMILIKEEDQSEIPDFYQSSRQYPVFSPNHSMVKNENVYSLPEGFKLESVPSSYSLSSDLMDVSVNYLQKDNTIEVNSIYHTKRSLVPVEGYSRLRSFRQELTKKNDQYIVLKKSSNISAEAKDWVKSQ